MEKRKCPKCSFETEGDYKFCPRCGMPLAIKEEPVSTRKLRLDEELSDIENSFEDKVAATKNVVEDKKEKLQLLSFYEKRGLFSEAAKIYDQYRKAYPEEWLGHFGYVKAMTKNFQNVDYPSIEEDLSYLEAHFLEKYLLDDNLERLRKTRIVFLKEKKAREKKLEQKRRKKEFDEEHAAYLRYFDMNFVDEDTLLFGYYPLANYSWEEDPGERWGWSRGCKYLNTYQKGHKNIETIRFPDSQILMIIRFGASGDEHHSNHKTLPIRWKLLKRQGNVLTYLCTTPLLMNQYAKSSCDEDGKLTFRDSLLSSEIPELVFNACFVTDGKSAFQHLKHPWECLHTMSIDEYEEYRNKVKLDDFSDLAEELSEMENPEKGHYAYDFSEEFWLRDSFLNDEAYYVDKKGKIQHADVTSFRAYLPYLEIDLGRLDDLVLEKRIEEEAKKMK